MSPPSWATAGRTRLSSSSLIVLHDLLVGLGEILARALAFGRLVERHRSAGEIVLHDDAEHRRLEMLPLALPPW